MIDIGIRLSPTLLRTTGEGGGGVQMVVQIRQEGIVNVDDPVDFDKDTIEQNEPSLRCVRYKRGEHA